MTVETEVKIKLPEMEGFRNRLAPLNPRLVSARHFEDNFLLDFPDGRLRSQGCLLRVRKTRDKESVTFKGPPAPSLLFKSREEFETQVENAGTVLEIFEQMGLKIWFRYQKYREEYEFSLSTRQGQKLQLALDRTPIGDYVELEGSEEGIRAIADKLGFIERQFLRDSYYALFVQFCRQRGEELGHMVFSAPGGGERCSSDPCESV